jgi:hypothetical protein
MSATPRSVPCGATTLDDQDGDAAGDQRPGDDRGVAEHRLDLIVQGEADHGRGQEADGDVAQEAPALRLAAQQAEEDRPEGPPVEHDDGEDRAELDDDVEHRPLLRIVAEQLRGQDQVTGRGDRDELGDTLDDAEQDDRQDRVHGRALSKATWRRSGRNGDRR